MNNMIFKTLPTEKVKPRKLINENRNKNISSVKKMCIHMCKMLVCVRCR